MMSKRNAGDPHFFFFSLPGRHPSRYTAGNDWE